MRGIIVRLLVNMCALLIVSYTIKGVAIASWASALVAAIVLGFVNAVCRPVILLVTLPINILSIGTFTFIVNAFLFFAVGSVVNGFTVTGFWPALFGSILFSLISFFLSAVINNEGKMHINIDRS